MSKYRKTAIPIIPVQGAFMLKSWHKNISTKIRNTVDKGLAKLQLQKIEKTKESETHLFF